MGKGNKLWRLAKRDAEHDMATEGEPPAHCPHPAPWNSAGPLREGGQSYTLYTCPDCGMEMKKHYY